MLERPLPAQCIEETISNNAPLLKDTMTQQQGLQFISEMVLQYLDAEGYTIIDADAVWTFHDELERWLNQDDDSHRLATFSPHNAWLDVWRLLPPRPRKD